MIFDDQQPCQTPSCGFKDSEDLLVILAQQIYLGVVE